MMYLTRPPISRFFTNAFAVLFVFLMFETQASAQSLPPETQVRAILNVIADYESPTDDRVTRALRELGYSPQSPRMWDSLPASRKLAAFYGAAEAGVPGDGNRALAAVADRMSAQFDSLRNNSKVSQFIREFDLGRPFVFNYTAPTSAILLAPESRAMITTLSTYAEGGRLGGVNGILTRIFGLERNRSTVIIAGSRSAAEAIMTDLGDVPSAEQGGKLKQLVAEAKRAYPAIAGASAIVAFETLGVITPPPPPQPEDIGDCICRGRVIGHDVTRSQCNIMPCF